MLLKLLHRQSKYILLFASLGAVAYALFRNPEDALPPPVPGQHSGPVPSAVTDTVPAGAVPPPSFPAGPAPGAGSVHSRQLSQPDSTSNSPPNRNELSTTRTNPAADNAQIGEALEPQKSAPSRPPRSTTPPPPLPNMSQGSQAPQAQAFHRPFPPPNHSQGATRKTSKSGGVQMVLGEAGSWSQLADQSSTLPAEGYDQAGGNGKGKNSGMLSFFSRKKGRDRSPKPQEPGVLGKEGARQIIGG